MKYKYVGTIPAVILVGDSLKNISPGEVVEMSVTLSTYFIEVSPPKPVFIKRAEPKKEIGNS